MTSNREFSEPKRIRSQVNISSASLIFMVILKRLKYHDRLVQSIQTVPVLHTSGSQMITPDHRCGLHETQ